MTMARDRSVSSLSTPPSNVVSFSLANSRPTERVLELPGSSAGRPSHSVINDYLSDHLLLLHNIPLIPSPLPFT